MIYIKYYTDIEIYRKKLADTSSLLVQNKSVFELYLLSIFIRRFAIDRKLQ